MHPKFSLRLSVLTALILLASMGCEAPHLNIQKHKKNRARIMQEAQQTWHQPSKTPHFNLVQAIDAEINRYEDSIAYAQRDREAWAKAQYENTIAGYTRYCEAFPNGFGVRMSRKLIKDLTAKQVLEQKNKEEERFWERARSKNSIPGYQEYLRRYRQGRFARQAHDMINAIKRQNQQRRQRELIAADDNAWNQASSINTVAAFNGYLAKYPSGRHAGRARAKRDNMQRRVKITVNNFYCHKSDDEGAGNDIDMNAFWVQVTAGQNGCNPSSYDRLVSANGQYIYEWRGAAVTVYRGHNWVVGRSIELAFDYENCNSSYINLKVFANEDDGSSQDEYAYGTLNLHRGNMIGNHVVRLESADFIYDCGISITKLGW